MASRDKVLAQMFAAEYRDRLSWRLQQNGPRAFCWHWKEPIQASWRPLGTDSIPLKRLEDYAKLDGLETTPEQHTIDGLRRVLELAKKELRG